MSYLFFTMAFPRILIYSDAEFWRRMQDLANGRGTRGWPACALYSRRHPIVIPTFLPCCLRGSYTFLLHDTEKVIIRLGDGPHDVLVLHDGALSETSERFAAFWEPTREVKDPEAGRTVRSLGLRMSRTGECDWAKAIHVIGGSATESIHFRLLLTV